MTPHSPKRDRILDAAERVFAQRGFFTAKVADIAKEAGVADGTIYLYFRDKESLFQELVRAMLSPLVVRLEAAPMADLPARAIAEAIADLFVRELFGTRRQDVQTLYSTRDATQARNLLRRYGVRYAVIGPLERTTYGPPRVWPGAPPEAGSFSPG